MKVMVATDGSPASVDACHLAVRMLSPERDEIRLLTVLSYQLFPGSLVPGEHALGEHAAEQRAREEVERLTAESRAALEEAGHRPAVVHRFGNPTDEIVAAVEEWPADLVVLGRRGVRGLERVLGSVSDHVLHHVRKAAILLVP